MRVVNGMGGSLHVIINDIDLPGNGRMVLVGGPLQVQIGPTGILAEIPEAVLAGRCGKC